MDWFSGGDLGLWGSSENTLDSVFMTGDYLTQSSSRLSGLRGGESQTFLNFSWDFSRWVVSLGSQRTFHFCVFIIHKSPSQGTEISDLSWAAG